eukprot:UN04466
MLSLAVISCMIYVGLSNVFTDHPIDPSYELYEQWIKQYEIEYVNNDNKLKRYNIWKENIESINKHNSGKHKWSQGVNKFTGKTFEEFANYHLMAPQNCSATAHNGRAQPKLNPDHPLIGAEPPEIIDWRDRRIISEVKNQGSCGSCWSFSTTGCLEAHYAQYTGQLTLFAEQQLVDCAGNFNNMGCNGGLPSQAFEYVMYNGGIDTTFYYHYVSGTTKVANKNCSYSDKANNFAGEIYGV